MKIKANEECTIAKNTSEKYECSSAIPIYTLNCGNKVMSVSFLVAEGHVILPPDLQELYRLYQQEIHASTYTDLSPSYEVRRDLLKAFKLL
jgi:hypothetical protein